MTNEKYRVFIDECDNKLLVIKFFLEKDKSSKTKYNRLSNLGEPRNVVYTCIDILMKEFVEKDSSFSISFIGANSIKRIGNDYHVESKRETKRFKLYSELLASVLKPELYSHYEDRENSAYLLIPNSMLETDPNIQERIGLMYERCVFTDTVSEESISL